MLTLALALVLAGDKPALPSSEAAKFRAAFAQALVDDAAAKKLVAQARALDAKYALPSLIDALRAGPKLPSGDPKPRKLGKAKESFETFGDVLTGLTFEHAGDAYGYLVAIPAKYDPAQPAPVVLDPGHGSGAGKSQREKADFTPYFRNAADEAGLRGALIVRTEIVEQIGADGLKGARPEDEVAAVFDALFADLASRFAIDPDRIYAAGISQTGFWSWYLGRARPDRLAGIAPIAAVTWQVDRYLDCYANLPVYVVHGEKDPVCKVEQPRRTTQLLKDLGFPVTYVELPGAEHGGPVFGRLGEALESLAKSPRDPWPKRVRRALLTTHAPHAWWARVVKLEKEGDGRAGSAPVAHLDARVEGQRVVIESRGIAELELALGSELLDLAQPVEVVWNAKTVHSDVVPASFATAVEVALAKADWRGAGPARIVRKAPR
jgi:dienelactone hydrolase